MGVHSEESIYKPGREPSPETDPVNTLILNFQPKNCEKINFCYLSHLVHDILLCQLEETNMIQYQVLVKNLICEIRSKVSCLRERTLVMTKRHEGDIWGAASGLFLDLSCEHECCYKMLWNFRLCVAQ